MSTSSSTRARISDRRDLSRKKKKLYRFLGLDIVQTVRFHAPRCKSECREFINSEGKSLRTMDQNLLQLVRCMNIRFWAMVPRTSQFVSVNAVRCASQVKSSPVKSRFSGITEMTLEVTSVWKAKCMDLPKKIIGFMCLGAGDLADSQKWHLKLISVWRAKWMDFLGKIIGFMRF